ncbi:hypothetical protein F2981_13945 [Sinorhizobium meliloti]|nr:hypothetical protein [Sinorhizobium meliloti]
MWRAAGGRHQEFAKAYVRYLHSSSPVSFENTMKRLDCVAVHRGGLQVSSNRPVIENLNVAVSTRRRNGEGRRRSRPPLPVRDLHPAGSSVLYGAQNS